MLQDQLLSWLQRVPEERGTRHVREVGATIATDRGLVRPKNEDRVAVMRIVSEAKDDWALCAAVSDGMGGMRDGAYCAALAVASFLSHTIVIPGQPQAEPGTQMASSIRTDLLGSGPPRMRRPE
jgi:serine/threonine protein phosphatase PrpC